MVPNQESTRTALQVMKVGGENRVEDKVFVEFNCPKPRVRGHNHKPAGEGGIPREIFRPRGGGE